MAYFFKVNNDSWGRVVHSSEQLSYDMESQSVSDDFMVSFHTSVNFEDVMEASRAIIGEVDNYTLTIEDEDQNILHVATDYVRLIKSEVNFDENDEQITCILTWSRV